MNKLVYKIVFILAFFPAFMPLAHAAYLPFNTKTNINVGIGTSTPQGAFVVTNGNVGIGTWVPNGALIVASGVGNVGIGSLTPGQVLDVTGTVRMTGLTLTGNGAANGYVMVGNSVGVGTWMAASTLATSGSAATNYWLNDTGNVGINTMYNVGIGTLSQINALNILGNVGVGTISYSNYLKNAAPSGGAIFEGNVGIGTWVPAALLDIGNASTGDIQIVAGPDGDIYSSYGINISLVAGGNFLSLGDTGDNLMSISGQDFQFGGGGSPLTFEIGADYASFYTSSSNGLLVEGNVGIGTTSVASRFNVNGGVGIGTSLTNSAYLKGNSAPSGGLIVQGNVGIGTFNPFGGNLIVNGGKNVGIGSLVPGQALDVQGTARMTGLTLTGNGANNGYVMVGNSIGVGTWMAASTLGTSGGSSSNYWLNDTGNVGINTAYNIGIGTLSQVNALNILGNIGIGTFSYDPFMTKVAPNGGMIISGNVGIGTWSPGALLTVNGASILGKVNSSIDTISASGNGALAGGNAVDSGGFTGNITSTSTGSLAFGYAIGTAGANGSIISNNSGSIALGFAGIGTLESTNDGSIALGYAGSGGILESTNDGSIAMGQAVGGNIESTGNGAIAMGYSNGGTLLASNLGSVAMGYENAGTLQATGQGSIAIGENVQATASSALAFGLNVVNFNANSFMVGFSTTPALTVTNTTVGVGISTYTSPSGALVVQGGNVGIGTFNPFGGGLIVLPANTGNVGIGSLAPGQALDVQGTVRMTGLTLTGNGAANGYVMVGNSVGVGTWMSASTLGFSGGASTNYWLNDTGNVGINTAYNVGIGTLSQINALNILGNVGVGTISYSKYLTTPAPSGGAIFEGNVGIGTWTPGYLMDVEGSAATIMNVSTTNSGNIGLLNIMTPDLAVGNEMWYNAGQSLTTNNSASFGFNYVGAGSANNYLSFNLWGEFPAMIITGGGNVGIGTSAPFTALQVGGTTITTSPSQIFMSSQPTNGNPLFVGNWQSTNLWGIGPATGSNTDNALLIGNASQPPAPFTWTSTKLNLLINGNIGIGTMTTTGMNASLYIASGNVGIGSLTPGQALDVHGTARMTGLTLTGNGANNGYVMVGNSIGVGTWMAATTLPISGVGGTNYWLNDTGNVGINTAYNIGIGTLSQINTLNILGNVGVGTISYSHYLTIPAPNGGAIYEGIVGIGTWVPGATLAVNGSSILGTAFSSTDSITSGSGGNLAGGFATHNTNSGNITSTGNGSLAFGYARGNGGTIGSITSNSSFGSIALGSAFGGSLESEGEGSIALGLATGILAATGNASVAVGENVQATNNNSLAFGETVVNPNASSFMVGFSATPALTVYNTTVGVGISTYTSPSGALVVQGGNVGIGTFNPYGGGLIVLPANSGNVGINSLAPGQVLDVTGTVRMTGLTLTGNGANNGYVMVTNSIGVGTWMPANTLATSGSAATNYWFNDTGNVGINTAYNVGIGTISQINALNILGNVGVGTISYSSYLTTPAPTGGAIFEGNVGIGTWIPGSLFQVGLTNVAFTINSSGAVAAQAGILSTRYSGGASVNTELNLLTTSAVGTTDYIRFGVGSNGGTEAMRIQDNSGTANVGIGTVWPAAALGIVGNIGIGTGFNSPYVSTPPPLGGMIVQNNVGIGSLTPGQALDVTGTARMTGLTLTGNGANNGYVMVTNSIGVGTWMPASTLATSAAVSSNYWLNDTGNVGISTIYAVGIGTSFVGGAAEASLSVMNGNVGIGTWVTAALLDVGINDGDDVQIDNGGDITASGHILALTDVYGSALLVNNGSGGVATSALFPLGLGVNFTFNALTISTTNNIGIGTSVPAGVLEIVGNVGIGTIGYSSFLTTTPPSGGMIIQGNVGIGSIAPGQKLDVQGTARVTGLTLTGNGANNGYVMVGNSVGVGTWMSASTLATSGAASSNYWLNDTGNVGINTAYNVGIGTISQINALNVLGNVGVGTISYSSYLTTAAPSGGAIFEGNVGIGTWMPWGVGLQIGGTPNSVVTNPLQIYMSGEPANGSPQFVGDWENTHNWGIGPATGSSTDNALLIGGTSFAPGPFTWISTKLNLLIPGNIGIGTITTTNMNASLYVASGNVGIGSLTPGQALDVQGTVRTTGFTLGGESPSIGYVLTSSDSKGDATWVSANNAGINLWLNDSGNVGINTTYNIGIGTISQINTLNILGNVGVGTISYSNYLKTPAPSGGAIFEGNVGIGTWVPNTSLEIIPSNLSVPALEMVDPSNSGNGIRFNLTQASAGVGLNNGASFIFTNPNVYFWNYADGNLNFGTNASAGVPQMVIVPSGNVGIGSWGIVNNPNNTLSVVGNIGIGTNQSSSFLQTSAPNGGMIVQSNVGIGSVNPGQILDVKGTVRTTGFTMSGSNPAVGYVLTSADSSGDVTWVSATNAGINLWLNDSGNVGINTMYNVGIGTLSQINALNILGNVGVGTISYSKYLTTPAPSGGAIFEGNIGIGTYAPNSSLHIHLDQNNETDIIVQNNTTGNNAETGLEFINDSNTNTGAVWTDSTSYGFGYGGRTTLGSYTLGINLDAQKGDIRFGTNTSGNFTPNERMRITTAGNVGLGTTTPMGALTIMDGNVGIGTWVPNGALIVANGVGNVGIGSVFPGQALDVTGTVRMTGLTLTGNGANNGYIMVGNSVGVGTWMPAITLATAATIPDRWLNDTGNVGISTIYAVGIGTSFVGGTSEASFSVMNGNVGIGTWIPSTPLMIVGNVGIATNNPYTSQVAPIGGLFVQGNVGIGTWITPAPLSVTGSILSNPTGSSTGTPVIVGFSPSMTAGEASRYQFGDNDNVMQNAFGDRMQITAYWGIEIRGDSEAVAPAFVTGVNTDPSLTVFAPSVATTNTLYFVNNAGTAINDVVGNTGNIGIGTWTAQSALIIATASANGGNVGIGSLHPGQALDVQGTARMTGLTLTGNGANNGYVMVGNSVGVGTWMAATTLPISGVGGTNYWLNDTGNVGINTAYNIGIGTLSQINTLNILGNVGVGTISYSHYLTIPAPNGGAIYEGIVGIGTWVPGATLAVNGSSILGTAFSSTDSITSGSGGNLAGGFATHNTNSGNITSTGNGSLAFGYARGNGGTIGSITSNSSFGSIALGSAFGGSLESEGEGSIALGLATGILAATGNASVAVGENVQATNNNSLAFGETVVNPNASSFMVGFSATPALTVYNTTVGVGISTYTSPSGALVVQGGNVGIGTFNPYGGGLIVLPANSGNVGINSLAPGQVLDVTGTVRMTGLTLTGNGANNGYVMVTNSIGVGTWMPANTLATSGSAATNYWFNDTGNVGINTAYNVGIGTISQINALNILGNVGVGTISYSKYLTTPAPSGGAIFEGNVGIGTWVPAAMLEVFGVPANATGIQVKNSSGSNIFQALATGGNNGRLWINNSSGSPTIQLDGGFTSYIINGNNFGIGTSSPGSLLSILGGASLGSFATSAAPAGGLIASGNVGIGTTTPMGGLVVMNGNVGIGTWAPNDALQVNGNIGVGTTSSILFGGVDFLTMQSNITNIFLGVNAGSSISLGLNNIAIGGSASLNNSTGNNNVVIGTAAGKGVSGVPYSNNTFVGTDAGFGNAGASNNAAFGQSALQQNTYGLYDVAIGAFALYGQTYANGNAIYNSGNTAVGYEALYNDNPTSGTNGYYNTALGMQSGYDLSNGSYNIILGSYVDVPSNSGTGQLNIGNLIYATGLYQTAAMSSTPVSGGNVGIGSEFPGQTLDVQGTVRTTGFTLSGDNPAIGYVLTSVDSSGDATWVSANNAGINLWFNDTGNVGINTTYNIGIGTISQINTLNILGNVGVGTVSYSNYLTTSAPSGGAIFEGNVGIGTWVPNSGLQLRRPLAVYRTGTGASINSSGQTIIGVTATPVTITLANTDKVAGRVIIVKDEVGTAGTNNITIQAQTGTIDGAASVVITVNYGVVRLYSDGNNWFTF